MSEFGDLANLDIDKLLRVSEEYAARSDELSERILTMKGTAASADQRVKVVCAPGGGVEDLHLDPRALRMPAKDLAELIKRVIHEANRDLQTNIQQAMVELMGADATPAGLKEQRDIFRNRAKEAAAAQERAVNDALGELERMRKQLGI